MSLILNIETSTKNCSVSIAKEGKLLCLCEETDENYSHSAKLHTFINWALEGAEIKASELEAICVSAGPGSYTGLRIGLAATKGLCFALDLPLISLYSLDGMAFYKKETDYELLIPMLDARRMEVYCAVYNRSLEKVKSVQPQVINSESFSAFKEQKVLFFGDGAQKCKEILKNPNWTFDSNKIPSAKDMIKLSYQKFLMKDFENLESFDPHYLKEFIAGKPKKLFT